MTTFDVDSDALVRLLAAAVLGAAVGADRETADQAAGLRTHIAVALGAALFGVVSTLGFEEFAARRATTNVNIDVARIASNVVVGVGFLGAGVITRFGNSIRNLTTAASIWSVAAIGLACGLGDIGTATVAAAVLLVCLGLLRPFRGWIHRRFARTSSPVRIGFAAGMGPDEVLGRVDHNDVDVDHLVVEKENGRLVAAATLKGHPTDVRAWITAISADPDVESAVQI